ncbi:DUF5658 family protein [Candidatus Bathyarchaeota archaeon]|nr:DUF5658 family protein [Candidatus Bathyarchaeota archaeon]
MSDKRILLLFFTFVLLNGLDVLTTIIGLEIGAAEANPTAQRLMSSLGLAEAMMLKFFLILLLGLLSLVTYEYALHRDPKYVKHTRLVLSATYLIGIVVYLFVVVQNVLVIWLQGSS